MAVNALWLLALLSLGFSSLSAQEKSVELSCGAGPVHVVLEPGQPLLLDCHLGATDTPLNITWLQNGIPVVDGEATQTLPNGSLVVLAPSREGREGRVPPAVEGGYSCISVSPLGALASRSLTIHLASLSRFLLHPEPQVVAMGRAARFECQVDGLPTPSIAWEKDQVPVPTQPRFISLPSGVLQILRVQEEDAGSYRCVATNAVRKRFSQEAMLTVAAGPPAAAGDVVIEAPPHNTTVVSGRPTVMECMAQGHPKPLVSWSRQDGKPIATDAVVLETNLLIPDTRSHHAGVYVCRANKPRTRDFVVAVAELRVLSPPVILQPPETVSLSRGNTARFVCNSSGEPAPTLHWLRNGEPVRPNGRVKTQSPGVLLINQLGAADAGYYQCIATNSLGTACATARLSVIVREGLPSPPQLLSAQPHSSSSVLLSWERPEHNSEHIIGFSVHYQQAGSGIVEYQFAVHNDTTEYLVKELLPHTAYTFYVVAYSPMGASRPSQSITVAMPEDVPIAPPQLSLLSTSSTDIHVMWLPLSPEHSRGAITRYRIDYSTLDEADHVSSVEVGGNDTQVTLHGLLPNRAYRLRMAAGTSAGFGIPSEWTLHHTPDHLNQTSVLYAPTELKVRAKMYSLHVTWQPPPIHTQVSGYKLQYRELEPENMEERVGAQPVKLRKRNKHYEITGLAADRMYEVKVWAYNKQTDGYAAMWKGRTERVPSTGAPAQRFLPPLPPSSLQASANSSTSIWLRWEKPRFSTVQIISYTVRCSPAGLRNASLVSYYTSSAQEILLGALKPFTRYALAVQSNGLEVDGPFSNTVEESTLSDRPSTPPTDLQLSALDPNSVLVSWRPPLEPNGIIVEYRILYSGNSSQPDHQWNSVSRDGSVTSTEVQGLMSATRYFFKMGACTLVGPGPLSPVKDIQTPLERYELDIPSVTGIIVGVCLGLLCILLCICVSFRGTKNREGSGGLDSSVLPSQSQYRRGRPSPAAMPECRDCHELETLMPPGTKDPAVTMTEVTEQHRLMGPNPTDDSLDLEPKPAWNGSVSRNWASRITRYRDTITEDSPVLSNGSLSPETRRTPDGLSEASCTEPSKSISGPDQEKCVRSYRTNEPPGSGIVEYQFAVHNDTTEYLVKELLPHTAYTFYVVAYSPMGASRPSQSITVAMPEDVPIAPPQLSLLSTSSTDIHVMWLPLSPEHSRGAITRYRIDYSTLDEADHVSSVEVGGNDTQVTLHGLLPNRAYRLRMAAGTSAGFGIPSEWTLHHTPDHLNQTSVLYAPTELKVRAKMYSLHVTWQPPPIHTQVSGYKLQYRELEPENMEERVGAQPVKLRKRNKHYEITGLAADRMYEVKVWAYNKQTDGYAAMWKGRTERVPSTGAPAQRFLPPLPPSSLQASANSSTSIWLRWEKPRFSTVQIISYTVRCSPAGLRNASLVSYYTSSAQEILLGALKPFTRYALAVQSNGLEVDGPFSNTVEESTLSDRPSTPPTDLQLSALDPNSVLVSWRPPLEPNGIIVEYRILYSGNSSQPDHQWNSVSRDGSVTSTEVQGLMSATRYFFKMGACTLVGPGPLSPVKDIQTPLERYELDIPSVTGIIVGVCLGLLCILLCICVSFRGTKNREGSGGLDSSVLPSQSQYRRGRPSPAAMPECRDCHELETLMPPGTKDPAVTMTEVTEQHRLMGPNPTDDSLDLEPKPAWNGSVSRNWASRITRYRDTITEDSPVLSNGSLSPETRRTPDGLSEASCTEPSKGHPGEMVYSSASRNRVEAEVIVHSELSDPECEQDTSSEVASSLGSLSPSLKDVAPAPEPAAPWDPGSQPQEVEVSSLEHRSSPATSPGVELTNGFHSPEHLENGNPLQPESRCFLSGKGLPPPLASSPSPFKSTLHSYVCP